MHPSISQTEQQIAAGLVEELLSHGYALGVNDGEETTVKRSTSAAAVLAAMGTTDEDYLLLWRPGNRNGDCDGWVRLVYGNGADLLSDWSLAIPDEHFTKTSALCDRLDAAA